MTTRIEDILIRARDTLTDPLHERWTNDRLIRLVDDAQKVIARHANLLRGKTAIALRPQESVYNLPDLAYFITRALDTEGEALPIISHAYADANYSADWETEIGTAPEALIYDKLNPTEFRVYPIPDVEVLSEATIDTAQAAGWNPTEFTSAYGVIAHSPMLGDTINSPYGLLTDLNYQSAYRINEADNCGSYVEVEQATLSSPYGILVGLEDSLWVNEEYDPNYGITVGVADYTLLAPYGVVTTVDERETNSQYGILTGFSDSSDTISLYYYREPAKVTTASSVLEISPIFDLAIKFYVTGMALRDYKDTENQAQGNSELSFFNSELAKAIKDSAKDYTTTPTRHTTPYVGAFNE